MVCHIEKMAQVRYPGRTTFFIPPTWQTITDLDYNPYGQYIKGHKEELWR